MAKKATRRGTNVEMIIDMSFSSNRDVVYTMMVALVLTFLISSSLAMGQASGGGHPDSKDVGVLSATVNDTTLKQTARAYVKVRAIVQKGEQAIDGTRDNAEKENIAAQIESSKLAAVKAEGLQPQQYNQVLQLVQADKRLRQRFLSYANQVKSGAE